MKKDIQNYYKNISENNNFNMLAILLNAKNNKTFNKLLKLCIKCDIQIVSINDQNIWDIRTNNNIINDINKTINSYMLQHTFDLINNINYDNIIVIIDKQTIELKKKIKNVNILKNLFINIFNDDELKKMCNLVISASETKKQIIKKITKYIAEQSN